MIRSIMSKNGYLIRAKVLGECTMKNATNRGFHWVGRLVCRDPILIARCPASMPMAVGYSLGISLCFTITPHELANSLTLEQQATSQLW